MPFGFDPLALGIIMVANLSIGTVTPLPGVDLFIASAIAKVGIEEILTNVWPVILALVFDLLLISHCPPLSTFKASAFGRCADLEHARPKRGMKCMSATGSDKPWTDRNSGAVHHAIPADRLGTASISPTGSFEAGSYATFTLTYAAGIHGIDDSGSLRVCFRFASDQSDPQFDNPQGVNYTTVEASNGAALQVRWDPKANVRPWDRTLWIKVLQGYLTAGDTIAIRFGVTEHGGPGMRLQTFCEDTFEFRVLVDPIATFNFQPLPDQPTISIVPGPPERYVAVLPTRRRVGQEFSLKMKGEDRWGNPSDQCDATMTVEAEGQIDGLPETVTFSPGHRATTVENLVASTPGRASVRLKGPDGAVVAESNPLIIEDADLIHFWGDLHGQSEETIGTGSADQYFSFARELAFVDACGHQGNDFQITDAFWGELNRLTAQHDRPGECVVLPGYEWSGNTSLGGDRNVFFPTDDRIIRRSSHALIEGGDVNNTDALTCEALAGDLAAAGEWDVVMYAHCGGRYADISVAHDGRFEKSVEVHSSWGSFEWILHDAFRLGYRVGVVANSDGHKGRPGASYPGAGKFGAIGGLTCFLMDKLDRETLLDCQRKRRHYGSTGGPNGRMIVDLRATFSEGATVYHDDPELFDEAEGTPASAALMGDIVHLPSGEMELEVAVETAAPIERVDIFNGVSHVETVRPYSEIDLGNRIRVHWEGAEYRGRFREVIWDGSAEVTGNTVTCAATFNFLNRDKTLRRNGNALSWKALTTGNFGGFDITLAEGAAGLLKFDTPLVKFERSIAEFGLEDAMFDESGELPRFVKLFRLPDENAHRSMDFVRTISLRPEGDNPIYVRLTQEDGTRAWTSPIYVFR